MKKTELKKWMVKLSAKLYADGLRPKQFTKSKAKQMVKTTVCPVGNCKIIDMFPSTEWKKQIKKFDKL